jgi:predicted nucleic acid-binding protein
MNARSFLDTNIIVYAFDQASIRKARIARQLITDGVNDGRCILSYQVVQEFVNVVLKGFRITLVRADLESFLLNALFPMAVVSTTHVLIVEGLRLQAAYQLSWYDSLIVAAALQGGCKVLYSEDLQSGQRFGDLVVENPFL